MGTALLVLQMLPLFLSAVKSIEELVGSAKQGSVKKSAALDLVSVGLKAAVSQKALSGDHADQITAVAPDVVDGVVGVLNGLGVFKKAAPALVQS